MGKKLHLSFCSYYYGVSIIGKLNPDCMNPPILADFDEIGVVAIGHKYSGHGEVSDRMGTSKTSLTKWFDHLTTLNLGRYV